MRSDAEIARWLEEAAEKVIGREAVRRGAEQIAQRTGTTTDEVLAFLRGDEPAGWRLNEGAVDVADETKGVMRDALARAKAAGGGDATQQGADQAARSMKVVAAMTGQYYRELIEQGMPSELAVEMTKQLNDQLMTPLIELYGAAIKTGAAKTLGQAGASKPEDS